MNFEIVDNIFQILVLFCVMTASAVTACKKKSRDFLLLAGGYGCFMMGTLYYVLYLIIMGKVPQIFYVAEISWLHICSFYRSRYHEGICTESFLVLSLFWGQL